MKKFIALLALISILMAAIIPAALAQQTVAPGGTVTVEIPFSGEEVRFVDFEYTLSAGLEFQKGEFKGGGLGKAGSARAIFLKNNLSGFKDGSLLLTVKAKSGATGEQSINVTSIQGYKLGVSMIALNGAGAKKIVIKEAEEKSYDVDGSGKVDMLDVLTVLYAYLDRTPADKMPEADVDSSGTIDMMDVLAVLYAYL